MLKRRALSCLAILSLLGGAASAEPILSGKKLQDGAGIEVGVIASQGNTEYAANNLDLKPNARGLFIRDRNGVTARMVIGLVIAIAGAVAQSGPKSVESKSYVSGDYLVTETKTTYYSEAEKAEMREATSNSIDSLFAAKYSDFQLDVYSKDHFGQGDASGYKLNMFIGSGDTLAFEAGMGWGKVSSTVEHEGVPTRVDFKYFGMPLRVSSVLGPARLSLTYEWNWLKYGVEGPERQLHADNEGAMMVQTASHPWHLELSTVVAGRFAVSAGATTQLIAKPKPGYFATVGLFF